MIDPISKYYTFETTAIIRKNIYMNFKRNALSICKQYSTDASTLKLAVMDTK